MNISAVSLLYLRRFLIVALLVASAGYLVQMAAALFAFGFSQPVFDQYMTYPHYIGKPFPASVLSNENGHRPIFPALVRVAEITWFQSNQQLQRIVGAGLMLLSWAGLLWLCLATSPVCSDLPRAEKADRLTMALVVVACTLALFWAGNIRMQVHANEQLHVYGVVLGLIVSLIALWKLREKQSWLIFLLVCFGGTVGTFSFGNGLVIFPTVFILGVLLRLAPKWLIGIFVFTIFITLLYTRGLPDAGVPVSIKARELPTGMLLLASWLNSAWVTAWLKFAATPAAQIDYVGSLALQTAWVGHSAHALVEFLGWSPAETEVRVTRWISVFAVAGAMAALARHIWVPIHSRLQLAGLGLMLFGLGTGALIVLFRVQYLLDEPSQLFADRYVIWSSLWWLGIALYVISFLQTQRLQMLAAVFSLMLAWALLLSSVYGFGWARIVHDDLNRQALGFRLNLIDHTYSASVSTMPLEHTLMVIELLKQHRLAQFAPSLIGPSELPADNRISTAASGWEIVSIEKTPRFHGRSDVWYFTGKLTRELANRSPYDFLVVGQDRVNCGSAVQTYDNTPPKQPLRQTKLGFAGYYVCSTPPDQSQLYARDHLGVWIKVGTLSPAQHVPSR